VTNILSKTALALVLAASSFSLPSTASAQEVQIGPNGVRLVQPCDPYYDDCDFDRQGRNRGGDSNRDDRGRGGGDDDYRSGGYDRRGDDGRRRDDDRYERRAVRFCSDDRALDKAERMGLRRVYVAVAGKRFVEVRGRNRDGRRVTVSFGRAPHCPVMR
jgi:hypothetical protein